jgi:hypothetical protein
MAKRPSWFDAQTEDSPLLTAMAELRLECTRAEHVLPHAKRPGSLQIIDAIMSLIDDWAENERGARDFFHDHGHSIGGGPHKSR